MTFSHCAALVREADRERYLATLFAPAAHRHALLALYAFNVEVSRVRALAREPMPGEIRLQWWRDVVSGERAGEAAAHPVASALTAAIAQYGIARDALQTLIDAHVFDLYDEPFALLDDLDNFAGDTESNLLTIAARMLGAEPARIVPLTRPAGIALTVARALGAFGHHAARRQLYVPLEVLERHHVDREMVFAGRPSEGLQDVFAELIRHARRQLALAQAGLSGAPESMLPALLPVATVGPALRVMQRRGYDPFRPAAPALWRRQYLLWRAARNPRRIFQA